MSCFERVNVITLQYEGNQRITHRRSYLCITVSGRNTLNGRTRAARCGDLDRVFSASSRSFTRPVVLSPASILFRRSDRPAFAPAFAPA